MHKTSLYSVFNTLHNIPNCQFYYVIHHLPVKYISRWLIMGCSLFSTGENSQDIKMVVMLVSVLCYTDNETLSSYITFYRYNTTCFGSARLSFDNKRWKIQSYVRSSWFIITKMYTMKSYLTDILSPRANKGSNMKKIMW